MSSVNGTSTNGFVEEEHVNIKQEQTHDHTYSASYITPSASSLQVSSEIALPEDDGSGSSYEQVSDITTAIRQLYEKLDAFHMLKGTDAHNQHAVTVRNICQTHLSEFRQRLQQMDLHSDDRDTTDVQVSSSSTVSTLSSPSHVVNSSSIGWMYAYAIPMEAEVYPQTDETVSFTMVALNKDKVETSLPEAEEMYRNVTDESKAEAKLEGKNWRFVKMGIAGRGNIAKRLKTEWAGLEAFNAVPVAERPSFNDDEKFLEALQENMPPNLLFLRRINSEMEKIIMEMFCNRVGASYDKVAWSTWVDTNSSIGFTETSLLPSSICDRMRNQIGIVRGDGGVARVQQFLQQVQSLSHEARLASPPLKLVVLHHPKYDPQHPQKHAPRLVPYFSFYKAAFKFSPKATPKMKNVQNYRQELYHYDQGASLLYPQYHESAIAAAAAAAASTTTTPKQRHRYSRSAGLPSSNTVAIAAVTPSKDQTPLAPSDQITSPTKKGSGFNSPFSADKKKKVVVRAMKLSQSSNEDAQV